MLNKRRKMILHLLIEAQAPVTINDLQKLFSVSVRTIRYDMKYISELLLEYNIHFKQHMPKGTWKIDFSTIQPAMARKLNEKLLYHSNNTYKERMLFIIEHLLNASSWVTLRDLANKLDVSRATVLNIMSDVNDWLTLFSLMLHRGGKGFKCIGTERNKMLAYLSIIMSIEYHLEITNPLTFLDFKNVTYKEAEWIFEHCKMEQFLHFHILIALFIERKRAGLKLVSNIEIDESDHVDCSFKIIEDKIKFVEENIMISFTETDKNFIYQYFLSTSNLFPINKKGVYDENFLSFVSDLETRLGISLQHSKHLVLLYKAWKKIYIQQKYDITIFHSTLDTLKERYSLLFHHAMAVSKENPNLQMISEHQLVPLIICLAIIYENIFTVRNKYRIWIVCHKGVATSQLLAITIKNYFPNLDVLEILSREQLKQQIHWEKPDFIISTIALSESPYPYIKVKPIMTKGEMQRIKQFITMIDQRTKNSLHSQHKIFELIPIKRMTFMKEPIETLEQLIRQGVDLLVQDDIVTEDFFQDLWKTAYRDNYFFEIVPRIMFFHTKSDNVLKPGLSLIQLKYPFTMEGKKIHSNTALFMATPDETSHIPQLEMLHKILMDKKLLEVLEFGLFKQREDLAT